MLCASGKTTKCLFNAYNYLIKEKNGNMELFIKYEVEMFSAICVG
jgi:hypothetical protein